MHLILFWKNIISKCTVYILVTHYICPSIRRYTRKYLIVRQAIPLLRRNARFLPLDNLQTISQQFQRRVEDRSSCVQIELVKVSASHEVPSRKHFTEVHLPKSLFKPYKQSTSHFYSPPQIRPYSTFILSFSKVSAHIHVLFLYVGMLEGLSH